ncbi:MAG: class I SAM-dependent methyltransferase [Maribacter sp.]
MSVLLKKNDFGTISPMELVEQIEAKNKCKNKLPSWYKTPKIYYPNKLNIEQCSSELTAEYKARIVGGKSLADLTGGFGVDSFYFSKKMEQVFHCEINENLSEIVAHNFDVLGVMNTKVIALDGLDFLRNSKGTYDWIYLDPSRRSESKRKVFLLSDCTPDIIEHLELLFKKSRNILLKTAPLLDISSGLKQLKNVKEIHVVAINNEVKELLWVMQVGFKDEVKVKTINLKKASKETYGFIWSEEKRTSLTITKPQNFLYEPNAAILKTGAFKLIAQDFKVGKLHLHSHLYTSEALVDFPGRSFKIENVIDYNKKELKKFSGIKANITVRNFPESVENIRKRFKIKDGGDDYLFFTTINKNQFKVIQCTKINADIV